MNQQRKARISKSRIESAGFQIQKSQYSKKYQHYMRVQYSDVEIMIKKIVKLPRYRDYYLRYPLDWLLKGVCKKMMINSYQMLVFGYFLNEVEWKLQHFIHSSILQTIPSIMHINQPTNFDQFKELSLFLYLAGFSIKQFLNTSVNLIEQQMNKIIPQFSNIQSHWTGNQKTSTQKLNPKILNKFSMEIDKIHDLADYNIVVDKIIQISPCYDINKNAKDPDAEQYLEPFILRAREAFMKIEDI